MSFVNDSLPHYPGLADRTRPFFSLSYPVPTPHNTNLLPQWQHYGKGYLDACFVLTWIIFFSVTREVAMSYILTPIARRVLYGTTPTVPTPSNGVGQRPKSHRKREERQRARNITRFSEQGFSLIYYVVYWSFGMYIYVNSPWAPYKLHELWIGYPHTPLPGPVKFYYLTQLAEWCHQLIILNIEARRKDHWQMFSHHIITIGLMIASYMGNLTRIGTMILLLMDFCDWVFPTAKMLRYVGFTTGTDIAFVIFLASWFLTRHLLFITLIYSTYRHAPQHIPLRWSPSNGLYLSHSSWTIFLVLLSILQVLMLIWFWMILAVALRVVTGRGAEDVRSDDEEDSEGGSNGQSGASVQTPAETRKTQ
ncbi:longevity assurance proteins LAG1/LAC1 [Dacryopinax primogenitus]|uniref:Longevity assurance proteins LAG1/LAC1 n=1 Tax=Dacryopinax primogenitus (strain DJM 731) TaxID=1858805 RepID=M5FRB8_DACPD|nr:longevity assurance proteins LAG1/LAC1 [Dacryopinax primogenitus]EJT97489.1 longevity assurance proteins LAG1/LAC1 [Dacryopinax primogenitus]